jgi:hypothetical protein
MQAHVVPRTYLKGFADKARGIGVYNSEPGKPAYFERNVKRVATQLDFYTLYAADGSRDETLETALSKLESQLRATLKVVRGDKPLGTDDYEMLALFAAMQEARSECHRHAMTLPLQQLRDELTKEMREQGLSDEQIDAATNLFFRKHLVAGDLKMDPSNVALLMVPEGIAVRYKFFQIMSKCIVKSVAHDFFTSDDPLTWIDTFRQREIGFDYLSVSAEVTYPLTRRYCLVMSYFPLVARRDASGEIVSIINSRTSGNALREVYAQPKAAVADARRFVEDIASIDKRRHPLVPFLIENPARKELPDLGALADSLEIDRRYVMEINQPFIEYFGSNAAL